MNKISILITAAGGAPALNIINALLHQKEKAVKIIAADTDPLSAGLYFSDKKYLIPKATDKKFLEKIFLISQKENVKIIFPGISLEYPIFSRNKKKFAGKGIIVPISDYSTVKICQDKVRTHIFFLKNNFLTAETYLPHNLPKKVNFPLILKPRVSSGSKGVIKVNNATELKFFMARIDSPVIQEYIDGQEYTIDAVADFKSNPIAVIPRKRLETMEGKSIKGVTVGEKKLVKIAQKMIKKLKIIGPVNIQCFKKKNDYFFTEVNCRFSAGGLPLTVASGVNIPLILLKICLGEKIRKKETEPKENLYMIRYFSEVFLEKRNGKFLTFS